MSRLALCCSPVLVVFATSVFGCSGSKPVSSKPISSEVTKGETTEDDPSQDSKGPDCHDDTCFVCGQGICLPGFFCDESNGQPNCQWIAKCGHTATCACLSEVLGSGCKCSERNGGVFIKCPS